MHIRQPTYFTNSAAFDLQLYTDITITTLNPEALKPRPVLNEGLSRHLQPKTQEIWNQEPGKH